MKVVEIDERTRLPLKIVASLILSISSVTIAGAIWVTTFYNNQVAQGHQLEKLSQRDEVKDQTLSEMRADILVIKTDLQYIKRAVDKRR